MSKLVHWCEKPSNCTKIRSTIKTQSNQVFLVNTFSLNYAIHLQISMHVGVNAVVLQRGNRNCQSHDNSRNAFGWDKKLMKNT